MNRCNITLDRSSAEPLHIQLSAALRRCILESGGGTVRYLPSERSLCEALKLNRSTVHRAYEALLNDGVVTGGTRRKLAVAPQARRLLAGAFPSIGVLLPEQFSSYIDRNNGSALRYLRGVFDRAAELKCSVFMLQIPAPGTPEEEMRSFIDSNFHKLIGIIHLGGRTTPEDHPLDMVFHYEQLPQIFISGTSELSHIGSVFSDFRKAGEKLARAMKKCGCRRVGIVHADPESEKAGCFEYSVRRRPLIMEQIFEEAGLEVAPEWILADAPTSPLEEKILAGIGSKTPLPHAFWCSNDVYAMTLCEILKKQGIRVPEDVKIAGFDGAMKDNALATIVQPFSAIGAGAVDLLLEHFEHGINSDNRIRTVEASFRPGESLR